MSEGRKIRAYGKASIVSRIERQSERYFVTLDLTLNGELSGESPAAIQVEVPLCQKEYVRLRDTLMQPSPYYLAVEGELKIYPRSVFADH